MFSILSEIPAEFWVALASGVGTIVAGIAQVVKKLDQKIELTAKNTIDSLASVMGKIVVRESEETVNNTSHLRTAQINKAETIILEYAERIVGTAPDFIDSLLEQNHDQNREIWITMWMNNVRDTMITDVLPVFVGYIQRNGLDKLPEQEYKIWARTDIAFGERGNSGVFGAFLKGLSRKFSHQKVRVRISWIEQNMDRKLIADITENVMCECRKLTMEYHKSREIHQTELTERIKNDIIATQAKQE